MRGGQFPSLQIRSGKCLVVVMLRHRNRKRRFRHPLSLCLKDVLAMIRIVLWCPRKEWASSSNEIDHGLRNTSAEFWSGRVIQGQDRSHPDGAWQDAAWQQAALHESTKKLRILGRHLAKSGWFEAPAEPPWKLRTEHEPAIVLFYSFKGGVGRSTALAATASHLASNGDRVVVLDAPSKASSYVGGRHQHVAAAVQPPQGELQVAQGAEPLLLAFGAVADHAGGQQRGGGCQQGICRQARAN